MDKYIGKRLEGRYEIQELIGTGGMANVYKAHDTIDQRIVAVKILRDEYLDNAEFLRRFKNESKAIAVLSHPNIVKVYDVSFNNRVHSIVMEHINGMTLKDYMARVGVMPWKEALNYTLQILQALQHAHDKGIVHRDIKPHNIMLLENGQIKVTDFGIARFARSESRTITDRAIGSVHYISPEQAMGESTDGKSDIYSVGVVLFEMLTGQLPFEAETAVSVAIKQIQTQAANPRSINPQIPEGLEEIVVRAMEKDPRGRYPSAASMIADIDRFKNNPSIHFEYKYLTHDEAAKRRAKMRGKEQARPAEGAAVATRSTPPYLAMLAGVTLAFVLASGVFILLMVLLNNPFTKTPERTMPNLVGMKYDTILAQYDDFEIVLKTQDFSDEYGKGVIYEQTPKAGTSIKVGSTVRVSVSDGQRIVTLPNFTDRPASEAISKIKDLGLEAKEIRVYSESVSPGNVVYTDPSRDSSLPSGTLVTVHVSQGPEVMLTNVPDLSGFTLESARRMLEQKNLLIGDVTEIASDQPAGVIVEQNPAVGALLEEGGEVNVKISQEGMVRYTLEVPLPTAMNRTVTVRARVGEEQRVHTEETLNPAEVRTWRPSFSMGAGSSELRIKIYIDGQLYREYAMFDDGSHVLERDRSDAAAFQS